MNAMILVLQAALAAHASVSDLARDPGICKPAPMSDRAPEDLIVLAPASYAQGSQTAGTLVLAGATDEHYITISDYTKATADTVTLTVNGTPTVLTEGTSWDCITSNNVCATNLQNAINAAFDSVMATASTNIVYIQPYDCVTFGLVTAIADGGADGAFGTATSGTGGGIEFWLDGLLVAAFTPGVLHLYGDIDSTTYALDWDVIDNNASAISWDTTGRAGVLELDTTNGYETTKVARFYTSATSVTAAGTSDYAASVNGTLNDTTAAGGTQAYTGLMVTLTETDKTGWDVVNLLDLLVATDTKFQVTDAGVLIMDLGDQIINSAAGKFKLYGAGGATNKETLTVDLETTANAATIGTDSGVVELNTSDIALAIDAPTIAVSGTDDYAAHIQGTLNDTTAGGGTETYRGLKITLTETDKTGWDVVDLIDAIVGTDSKFRVTDAGVLVLDLGDTITNSAAGAFTLSGAGGAVNKEALTLDFETTPDQVGVSSTSGVDDIEFGTIDLNADEGTFDGDVFLVGGGKVSSPDLSTAAATGDVAFRSGDQTNAGDHASGSVSVYSGISTTLGDTGAVAVYSGNAADSSGAVDVYSGTSANTAEVSGAVSLASGNQTHATGGTSGAITIKTGTAAGTAATGGIDIYSGNQLNAGDYASGPVAIRSGTSVTLGDTGNVSLYSGNAADTSGTASLYSGTSANAGEKSGEVKMYSGAQTSGTGGSSGDVKAYSGATAGTAASGAVSLYSGNQTNAGDYASGALSIYTGTSATLGDTGAIDIYTGNAADTSGAVAIRSGTSANTAEASGAVSLYSGAQSHATGGQSGAASLYTGTAAGAAQSGGVSIYTGAQSNAGDYASGSIDLYTGATTTDGVTGNITLKTGAAGAGATDAGSIYLQTHGANTRVSVTGSSGLLTAFNGLDVQGGTIVEGDGTYSWDHTPSGIATEGTVEIDGMAYLDGGGTFGGPMICAIEPIADGDATPDVSGGDCFTTVSNTGPTAITDLDSPTAGQRVLIIGGSNTNSSTIADAGNFNLDSKYGAMTLSLSAWILIYVQADNTYIEIGRGDNTGLEAMTVASLDASDGNITNVGDIGADSISADTDSTTMIALATGTLNYHLSNAIYYTMDSGALTCDTPVTGADAASPAIALTGNNFATPNNYTGNVQLQGFFSDGNPFLRISVDDDITAGDGNLTAACDIYDTAIVPANASADLGATANPWHTIYGNLARIGTDSMSADANYALHVVTATAGGGFRVTGTDAGAAGVNLVLQHDSVSPLDGDVIGQWSFNGDDSAGNESNYGLVSVEIQDPTNTPSEEGIMRFKVLEGAGSLTEYVRLDGTDNITSLVASRNIDVQEAKGQKTTVPIPTTVELACDSAATLSTVAGFIPAGVYLHGITTRVTSAGLTGPTSMDIGDGSVANLWGDDETVADNDTTDNTDATANWSNPLLAQSAVVLTWNGGNCTAGTIRVSAHYTTVGAPTAD